MSEATRAYNVVDIPGLKELWDETLGDPHICIAILDGPVDQSHPSLASANLTQLKTLVLGVADQGPSSRHGTHIASVIFGQHDGPVNGIAPNCRGLIVPIFRDGADGSISPCSQVDLARAISQAVQEGAQVINISGGELTPSGTAHPLLDDVVRNCADNGVLIVAAAGNEGCACLHIPGALPSVLAVGAMNSQELPLGFSNWGEKYQTQGILAPGEGIIGATPGGETTINSGTSYATPIVSGIIALMLSIQLKRGLEPDPHVVRGAILSSAVGCDEQPVPVCDRLLAGRLNIKKAMTKIIIVGGNNMSDRIEVQENNQSQADENVETQAFNVPMQAPEVRAAGSDNNGSKSTEVPSQSRTSTPEKLQKSEEPLNQGTIDPSAVSASACGYEGGAPPQLVFAIGQLGYDFGTESRRDSIMQHMEPPAGTQIPPNPHDPGQLIAYLEANPWDAAAIIWTLNFDTTPIYAIQGQSAFASDIYRRLRDFLCEQIGGEPTETGGCMLPASNQNGGKVERVSIAGYIAGQARLLTGQVVPVIWPDLRCMYGWNTADLINAICGEPPSESAKAKERETYTDNCEAVANFLERVYHELRNLGTDPCHRAINYSATNALNITKIFESAIKDNMQLDTIECEPSPICRPGSDCWDVKLMFFDPENQRSRARKVYRFTVDVSDVCPVMVGAVRSWFVR